MPNSIVASGAGAYQAMLREIEPEMSRKDRKGRNGNQAF
jgi:hypothetical protein